MSIFGSLKLRPWNPALRRVSAHYAQGAEIAAFLNRLTDAADMPDSRAACRTPLPAANSRLALSTLAAGIGGRPARIAKARLAA